MIHTESIIIRSSIDKAFEYLKKEENHPTWGVNFLKDYEKTNEGHFVTTPMGRVELKIKADKETGVIDIVLGERPTPTILIFFSPDETLYLFTLILPNEMPKPAIEEGIKGLKEELLILKEILEGD
ncbi:MAG: hypothetical protein IH840_10665 [Candidatus Heimdallarchaeota archaeon]|nr:hypothetical protein [Candidatus Heimdallarchaeota archaeon]